MSRTGEQALGLDSFQKGFDAGWQACESFYEQQVLNNDPGFQAWLDKLEQRARHERERNELNLQQQHAAAQAFDDEQMF